MVIFFGTEGTGAIDLLYWCFHLRATFLIYVDTSSYLKAKLNFLETVAVPSHSIGILGFFSFVVTKLTFRWIFNSCSQNACRILLEADPSFPGLFVSVSNHGIHSYTAWLNAPPQLPVILYLGCAHLGDCSHCLCHYWQKTVNARKNKTQNFLGGELLMRQKSCRQYFFPPLWHAETSSQQFLSSQPLQPFVWNNSCGSSGWAPMDDCAQSLRPVPLLRRQAWHPSRMSLILLRHICCQQGPAASEPTPDIQLWECFTYSRLLCPSVRSSIQSWTTYIGWRILQNFVQWDIWWGKWGLAFVQTVQHFC